MSWSPEGQTRTCYSFIGRSTEWKTWIKLQSGLGFGAWGEGLELVYVVVFYSLTNFKWVILVKPLLKAQKSWCLYKPSKPSCWNSWRAAANKCLEKRSFSSIPVFQLPEDCGLAVSLQGILLGLLAKKQLMDLFPHRHFPPHDFGFWISCFEPICTFSFHFVLLQWFPWLHTAYSQPQCN